MDSLDSRLSRLDTINGGHALYHEWGPCSRKENPLKDHDTEESVIMRVICEKGGNGEDDDCGVWSVYRFYRDGSFRAILNACGHCKRFPTRARILEELAKAQLPPMTNGGRA